MRSVIAEAHFDGSRNAGALAAAVAIVCAQHHFYVIYVTVFHWGGAAVVMLGGLRRWILAHPDQCVNM